MDKFKILNKDKHENTTGFQFERVVTNEKEIEQLEKALGTLYYSAIGNFDVYYVDGPPFFEVKIQFEDGSTDSHSYNKEHFTDCDWETSDELLSYSKSVFRE